MVKHTQTNRWQFAGKLFEFDHFVKLVHKGLKIHFVFMLIRKLDLMLKFVKKN